jgi:hypothetical protein
MTKNLRYFGIFLLFVLLTLSSLAYRLPTALIQEAATPGPKVKATVVAVDLHAGNTDGIIILGILIFAFIAIPILLHFREWRTS